MAGDANVPRKLTGKKLGLEVDLLKISAGMAIKATRATKSPTQPDGARQTDVASQSGLAQSQISRIESGDFIPPDEQLVQVMTASGFDMKKPGSTALLNLMKCLRDNGDDLKKLEGELPD